MKNHYTNAGWGFLLSMERFEFSINNTLDKRRLLSQTISSPNAFNVARSMSVSAQPLDGVYQTCH